MVNTVPMIVKNSEGVIRQLGEKLAEGGEGAVYPVLDHPDILVKCYHQNIITERGQSLQNKIETMISMRDSMENIPVIWPRLKVYGENSKWAGYAMRRAVGVPMIKMAHTMLYKKYFPQIDRKKVVAYLYNLLVVIESLHKRHIFIGDFNLNNIFLDPKSDRVTLIDCDSYQISYQGQYHACPVGSPDMTPIEHHGKDFSQVIRSQESEAFSVAIVLFKSLMLGRHPYDIVGGEDPVTNMQIANFAYGKGNRGIPKGSWYLIWSHMPHSLKDAFIQTFTLGARDPKQRLSIADWKEVLQRYRREMDKGWHEAAIVPAQVKSATYRGTNSV